MSRIQDRINALDKLKDIDKNENKYLVIHYASQSFFDLNGKSPKIASIAVEELSSGQTELFAIYKTAEEMNIDLSGNLNGKYSTVEKKMLDDFFEYVQENSSDRTWLHWNMRDSSFGFQALEHRYRALGGKPVNVSNTAKLDIAQLFKDLYGSTYIEDPRMFKLMEKNSLKPQHILSGKEEATAFDDGKFYELAMSTNSKVRLFVKFIKLAIDDKLLVNSTKRQIFGDSIQSHFYQFKETKIFKITTYLATLILGSFISKIVELFF